jgi:cation transport regulator ChaC
MSDDVTYYFAYGSNMGEDVITSVTPSAEKVGIARLVDYRLAFTRESVRWKAGVADVVRFPGLSVYGVIYGIRTDELGSLDRKEGAPKAYRRISVAVALDKKMATVMTYSVTSPEPAEIAPHPDYLAQMSQAAADNRLPGSYRQFLEYLKTEFRNGTREIGLMLTPTGDRRFAAGAPLLQLNQADAGQIRRGSYGALIMDGKAVLGRILTDNSVPRGTCQADQSMRVSLGASGQFSYGYRAHVLPCHGSVPRRSPVRPRAILLPAQPISSNDGEKNYCVLHPDRIKVLGLQEGDYARLYVVAPPDCGDRAARVNAVSMRVFSGSASHVVRESGVTVYPDHSELYLDRDTRLQLRLPDSLWSGTPVLVRPALWKALLNRVVFYGVTVLLGIGAFFQLIQSLAPGWSSDIDALIALLASAMVTIGVAIIDLRSRFRH